MQESLPESALNRDGIYHRQARIAPIRSTSQRHRVCITAGLSCVAEPRLLEDDVMRIVLAHAENQDSESKILFCMRLPGQYVPIH